MSDEEIEALRRRAGSAYARWRAADAMREPGAAPDQESRRLKHELDVAAQVLFAALRPSLATSDGVAGQPVDRRQPARPSASRPGPRAAARPRR